MGPGKMSEPQPGRVVQPTADGDAPTQPPWLAWPAPRGGEKPAKATP